MLNRRLKIAMFVAITVLHTDLYADCKVSTSHNLLATTIPSITLAEQGELSTQFSAGLSCSGLGAGNKTYLKYQVSQLPLKFVNATLSDSLNVIYLDTNKKLVTLGEEVDLTSFSLINFFSGPDGAIPFYLKIPAGQSVAPGRYVSETLFEVRWFYSVPALSVGGIGFFHSSPGFRRPSLLGNLEWGAGESSGVFLMIDVLPDCRITVNDVNLGTSAFVDKFEPVVTSMGVRCSAKTPYTVSLNNGMYAQGDKQRAMKLSSGNSFMKYEIYKNTSMNRWGSASESWSSAQATINSGQYNGRTQQGYSFTTKILPNQSNLPVGTYSDTVTVQVEF